MDGRTEGRGWSLRGPVPHTREVSTPRPSSDPSPVHRSVGELEVGKMKRGGFMFTGTSGVRLGYVGIPSLVD